MSEPSASIHLAGVRAGIDQPSMAASNSAAVGRARINSR
jgi:hypothetical protein